MTLAMVALSKEGFYIVADSNSIHGDTVYTQNTQKVFVSTKHKILLCIAGNGFLDPQDTNNHTKLIVNHVIQTFFNHIETLESFGARNLTAELIKFADNRYPEYHNYFRHQANANHYISYFYGGFQNGTPAIYSHHNGKDSGSTYAGYSHFFSNSNAVKECITKTLSLSDSPITSSQELVTDPNYMATFFQYTLPVSAISINAEKPSNVGNYLHVIWFEKNNADAAIHIKYKCEGNADQISETIVNPTDMPTYKMYKDSTEEAQALISGELVAYDLQTNHQITIINTSTPTAVVSSPSSSAYMLTTHPISSNSTISIRALIQSLQNIDEERDNSGSIIGSDSQHSEDSNSQPSSAANSITSHNNMNIEPNNSEQDIAREILIPEPQYKLAHEDSSTELICKLSAELELCRDLSNTLLNHYLSWIYQLPEWMQNNILGSKPIKTLIESIKRNAAIYEIKSVVEDFYDKAIDIKQKKEAGYRIENEFLEKAQVIHHSDSNTMIDTSLVYTGTVMGYLILPTLIESIHFSGKVLFPTGEIGLNMLNQIEIF